MQHDLFYSEMLGENQREHVSGMSVPVFVHVGVHGRMTPHSVPRVLARVRACAKDAQSALWQRCPAGVGAGSGDDLGAQDWRI